MPLIVYFQYIVISLSCRVLFG